MSDHYTLYKETGCHFSMRMIYIAEEVRDVLVFNHFIPHTVPQALT